jgi:acyl-coenzyme A thioesterase PaaI-like protein
MSTKDLQALPINSMVDGESHRIAAALQKINNALVGKNIPLAQSAAYADQLEKIAREFSALTTEKRQRDFGVIDNRSESSVGSAYEYGAGNSLSYRPISGNCNAVSPRMQYFLDKNEHTLQGKVTFSAAYEGPPGLVHGGYIAACMDEMFGIAVSHSDIKEPCMTGTLKVIYRAPVPLLKEITYRSWMEKEEGRKVFAKCTVTDSNNNLCCEGEAIFLKIDPSIYAAMQMKS